MIPQRIIDYLQKAGVDFARITHPRAVSAQELAASVHVTGYRVAKAVLAKVDGNPTIIMLPAAEMLDEESLIRAIGANSVELMTEPEFEQLFPDCEVGAEPPFGGLFGLPVIADECIAEDGDVILRAGSHEEALRMSWKDFANLERPRVADVGITAMPQPPREAFQPAELR